MRFTHLDLDPFSSIVLHLGLRVSIEQADFPIIPVLKLISSMERKLCHCELQAQTLIGSHARLRCAVPFKAGCQKIRSLSAAILCNAQSEADRPNASRRDVLQSGLVAALIPVLLGVRPGEVHALGYVACCLPAGPRC